MSKKLKAAFSLLLVSLGLVFVPIAFRAAEALPAELSDGAFWKLIMDFSEEGGSFPYENFVSNEAGYQEVIPGLKKIAKPGGVYLGVGPEQNFTYIGALRPQMAFIVDIRRQNMIELLMYKALFEMSPARADFIAALFARKRPSGLDETSTPEALFAAFDKVERDRKLIDQNQQRIKDLLIKQHGFGLTSEDVDSIGYVYRVFVSAGPDLSYAYGGPNVGPTYEGLMTLTDRAGMNWSYLASEENYRLVREMQRKNLIVPLVGNFGGTKAIRAVAAYLKEHDSRVSAFYLSNVEQYLTRDLYRNFSASVGALPLDDSSMFIRFIVGLGSETASMLDFVKTK